MVCRRRFVAELLMSLHDSPLADAQTRRSAMHALTAATHLPAYAKDLLNRAGEPGLLTCIAACPVTHKRTQLLQQAIGTEGSASDPKL